jgi:hypothetical protein
MLTVNFFKLNKIGGRWGYLDVPAMVDYVTMSPVLHICKQKQYLKNNIF